MKWKMVLPRSIAAFALCLSLAGAEKKVITPPGATPPVGPYSPGILAGGFLYVSGQGAARADGTFPTSTEAQVAQALNNLKAIVEGAGLTMEHVIYAQLYLKNIDGYNDANRAWARVFASNPPARATLGISRMPTDTPVEINAVAVQDLKDKKVISAPGLPVGLPVSAGILARDLLFLSSFPAGGREQPGADAAGQVRTALDSMGAVLKAAGMDFRNLVFTNPYLTDAMPMDVMNKVYASYFEFGNTPARATIRVASLPDGATVEFTGVAIKDLSKRQAVRPKNMPPSPTASPCVLAGDVFYCSAKSGFIPGPHSGIYAPTVGTQLRQTMRNLLDGLEEAGLTMANVVAANVYLDDLNDFAAMNKVYASYFSGIPPTRTTIQQVPPGERKPNEREIWPTLEQISIIAIK